MTSKVIKPYETFNNVTGLPLESGSIYIGTDGTNPEIAANQISVFWDSNLTDSAAQPIKTIAGFPSRGGSPGKMYVSENKYSITVRDKNGKLIYSTLSEVGTDVRPFEVADVATLQANMVAGKYVQGNVVILTNHGIAGPGVIYKDDGATHYAHDNGVWVTETGSTTTTDQLAWRRIVQGDYSGEWWGTTGDGSTDDLTPITNAEAYVSANGGGNIWYEGDTTYAVSNTTVVGSNGARTNIMSVEQNAATFKALSAFTGGIFNIQAGGVNGANFTGFDKDTASHDAITIGNGSATNVPAVIRNVLNNGGFYNFISSVYEFDNSEFDNIVSLQPVGYAAMNLQTGGSYAHSATPLFKRIFLRNPTLTPTETSNRTYGLILKRTDGANIISGQISNFSRGLYLLGENRNPQINLTVFDLRSAPTTNELWETEWSAGLAVTAGDYIKPTKGNANGHFYRALNNGTTHATTEPTWPTSSHGTVNDNGITWTEIDESICISIFSEQQVILNSPHCDGAIAALYNEGNANIVCVGGRYIGENAAVLNVSGSNAEIAFIGTLLAGDVHVGTFRISSIKTAVQSDTLSQMPDNEDTEWSNTNRLFASGNGVDFSATNRSGATTQLFKDYARGTWSSTVSAGTQTSSPAFSEGKYVKIGHEVSCFFKGTVTISTSGVDANFKFTVPFAMEAVAGIPGGSIRIYLNGNKEAIMSISDWTGGNNTEVGANLPAVLNTGSGAASFIGFVKYMTGV